MMSSSIAIAINARFASPTTQSPTLLGECFGTPCLAKTESLTNNQ